MAPAADPRPRQEPRPPTSRLHRAVVVIALALSLALNVAFAVGRSAQAQEPDAVTRGAVTGATWSGGDELFSAIRALSGSGEETGDNGTGDNVTSDNGTVDNDTGDSGTDADAVGVNDTDTGNIGIGAVEPHHGHGEEHGHSHGHDADHDHTHQPDVLIFLFMALLGGTAVLHLSTLPRFAGLQQSVMLFVFGMVFSLIVEGTHVQKSLGSLGASYSMWMDIDPHLLLYVMLPPLLMGDAMVIDTNVAQRVAKQCLYLAGPGVLFNAFAAALFLQYYLGWSFYLSLVVGSILCATDPVAVVALLKELGASPTLTVQIQGESLLNDGTAIVLYTVAYNFLKGKEYSFLHILSDLVKTAGLGWLLGMLVGYLCFLWIAAANDKLGHHSSMIQISLTLCCAYVSFFAAETFKMSGVLSTVAASLTLAHNMWPHVSSMETMHHVWHTFEFLGNTIIFFLAGGLVGRAMTTIPAWDYVNLVVIYLVLLIVRGVLIFASRPVLGLLSPDRKAPSLYDATVMTWGGLRGAVGLALAISVYNDRATDDAGLQRIDEMTADRVVFFVGGVALLTTVVNATTAPRLVNMLGITAIPHAKRTLLMYMHRQLVRHAQKTEHPEHVMRAMQELLSHTEKHLGNERVDKTLKALREMTTKGDAALDAEAGEQQAAFAHGHHPGVGRGGRGLSQMASIVECAQDNGEIIDKVFAAHRSFEALPGKNVRLLGELPHMMPWDLLEELIGRIRSTGVDEGMAKVVNDTFLKLVYSHYWDRLQTGDLRADSKEVGILLDSIQKAQGLQVDLSDLRHVQKALTKYSAGMLTASEHTTRTTASKAVGARLIDSAAFCLVVDVMILCNVVFLVVEKLFHEPGHDEGWFIMEAIFAVGFVVEMLFKFWALSFSGYFSNAWCVYEFVLVATCVLGLIVHESGAPGLRFLRMARLYRVLQNHFLSTRISEDVANSMTTISTLVSFVHAHILSQREFVKFFGVEADTVIGADSVDNPEVARCLLQSQIAVYKALVAAVAESRYLDPALLKRVLTERANTHMAKELQKFVLEAHHAGVIGKQDAESILHPLNDHILHCAAILKDCADGVESVYAPSDIGTTTGTLATIAPIGSQEALDSGDSQAPSRAQSSCTGVAVEEEDEEDGEEELPQQELVVQFKMQVGSSSLSITPELLRAFESALGQAAVTSDTFTAELVLGSFRAFQPCAAEVGAGSAESLGSVSMAVVDTTESIASRRLAGSASKASIGTLGNCSVATEGNPGVRPHALSAERTGTIGEGVLSIDDASPGSGRGAGVLLGSTCPQTVHGKADAPSGAGGALDPQSMPDAVVLSIDEEDVISRPGLQHVPRSDSNGSTWLHL